MTLRANMKRMRELLERVAPREAPACPNVFVGEDSAGVVYRYFCLGSAGHHACVFHPGEDDAYLQASARERAALRAEGHGGKPGWVRSLVITPRVAERYPN